MNPPPSKDIDIGNDSYITIPVRSRPSLIGERDWQRLSELNARVLDMLSYDHVRARSPRRGGVQTPDETSRRGMGVCVDYAALFEKISREAGYITRSITSDRLDHAWNEVRLAGRWWIVDVTWNDADSLVDGGPIPLVVRNDPDFRRRFLCTTPEEESVLFRAQLIQHTHDSDDLKVVDYEWTVRARLIVDEIKDRINELNQTVRQNNDLIARREVVRRDYNATVDRFNSATDRHQQQSLRPRLDELDDQIKRIDASLTRWDAEIKDR